MTTSRLGEGRFIQLGAGAASTSDENRVITRGDGYVFDFVALLDSRAAKTCDPRAKPFVEHLEQYLLRRGASYLILTRPLNLTVFPTLVALHRCNTLQCDVLLTNVGFVDTTPKKREVLRDLERQLSDCSLSYSRRDLEEYELQDGTMEMLGTCELSPASVCNIAHELGTMCQTPLLLTTPQMDDSCYVGRERPECFLSQLHSCNELVHSVAKHAHAPVVDIHDIGIRTYDGL